MEITSNKAHVEASAMKLFTFLSDTNNFVKLLPEDKISEWKADGTSCSFKVQKAATIALEQKELKPYSELVLTSGEKSPFPFNLTIFIQEKDSKNTEAFLQFEGEVNAFLKAMIQKPLTNLFNHMASKLEANFEG